jgi:hypothetical protein
VWLDLAGEPHDLVPIGSDANDLEARILCEPRVQRVGKHTVIVHDQNSHDFSSLGGGTRHRGSITHPSGLCEARFR